VNYGWIDFSYHLSQSPHSSQIEHVPNGQPVDGDVRSPHFIELRFSCRPENPDSHAEAVSQQ
jgi:hypothetical protein